MEAQYPKEKGFPKNAQFKLFWTSILYPFAQYLTGSNTFSSGGSLFLWIFTSNNNYRLETYALKNLFLFIRFSIFFNKNKT